MGDGEKGDTGVGMKEEDRSFDWIPIAIGVVFLAVGVISITTETIGNSMNRTAIAEGRVVEIESKPMGEGFTILANVKFVTEGGRSLVSTLNTREGGLIEWINWEDRIGESVSVRYDPADPADARIDSVSGTYSGPAIFLVAGGLITFFGIRRGRKLSGALKTDANGNGLMFHPPPRDPSAASYCPMCLSEFRVGFQKCADCGVDLEIFV